MHCRNKHYTNSVTVVNVVENVHNGNNKIMLGWKIAQQFVLSSPALLLFSCSLEQLRLSVCFTQCMFKC